jgi:hypothetical protein
MIIMNTNTTRIYLVVNPIEANYIAQSIGMALDSIMSDEVRTLLSTIHKQIVDELSSDIAPT